MRNLALAAAALAALALSGVAVARGIESGRPVTAVRGTFTATTVRSSSSHTCTSTTGRTIVATQATYTGTASGRPELVGPATITALSTIDAAADVGIVTGTLRVGKTDAHFSAVYDHGSVAGLATGQGASHAQLVANVSAAFSAAGGFTRGKVGATSGGSAVELALGRCQPPSSPPQHKQVHATGIVKAASTASITVGRLTCAVPPSLGAPVVINFNVGASATITCELVNGTETLVTIDKGH